MLKPVGAFCIVEGRTARAKICSSAKGPITGTRDNDGTHRIVRIRHVEGGDQVFHHLAGKGIHPVGPVERDGQDAIAGIGQNGFKIGHGKSPSSRASLGRNSRS
jgi:hypothetical protein